MQSSFGITNRVKVVVKTVAKAASAVVKAELLIDVAVTKQFHRKGFESHFLGVHTH